jgi:uracil-DNA glycosylase
VHQSWAELLAPERTRIDSIFDYISRDEFLPPREFVFRALDLAIDEVRAIILGQDPYPTPGMAEGFSFSVAKENSILPPSLKNIFREYSDDLGLPMPRTGHLGKWCNSGVLLLNRILTVEPHAPLSHQGIGWEVITDRILQRLSEIDVPIICWGGQAEKAAVKNGFASHTIFASPHPSPLSAYRGFFGSKPFSSVNKYLMQSNAEIIDWNLESD